MKRTVKFNQYKLPIIMIKINNKIRMMAILSLNSKLKEKELLIKINLSLKISLL